MDRDGSADLADRAGELVGLLAGKSLRVAAAESCTGGLLAAAIAGIPGASNVLWGSFVCYTAEAQQHMLGIEGDVLRKYGLVSGETARAMAEGALIQSAGGSTAVVSGLIGAVSCHTGADCAVSVTGLAGPEGDGSGLPVGTVWVGTALKNGITRSREFHFKGSRNEVRAQAARQAIREITNLVQEFY
jgi:nicotinamide mononucleotide (NMN) deamidase PncC